MPRATASTDVILAAARGLVAAAAPLIAERGLTLVGFAVSNIDRDGAQQLELPFDVEKSPTPSRCDSSAVDEVRQRFGNAAVTRGVLSAAIPAWRCRCCPTKEVVRQRIRRGER